MRGHNKRTATSSGSDDAVVAPDRATVNENIATAVAADVAERNGLECSAGA
jgi:hypothetical protein